MHTSEAHVRFLREKVQRYLVESLHDSDLIMDRAGCLSLVLELSPLQDIQSSRDRPT